MTYLTLMEIGVTATSGIVASRSISLDTNAVIAAVEGGAQGAAAIAKAMGGKAPVVSTTVVAEFAKKGNMTALMNFLRSNGGVVVKGAPPELVKQFEARGLKPADAQAVATAAASRTRSLTRDKDISKKVPEIAQPF
jgi:predicted nucleic acid-binding protein